MTRLNIILLAIVFAIAIAYSLYSLLKSRGLLKKYWVRSCTGKEWKRQFPNVSNRDIRNFLEAFTMAFLFSSKRNLKFKPDDKVMDIYHALYPVNGADACELEAFAMNLEKNYAIDLYKVPIQNITLGELFEMTRKVSQ